MAVLTAAFSSDVAECCFMQYFNCFKVVCMCCMHCILLNIDAKNVNCCDACLAFI